jgi:uncharacterized protein with ParB-like and HNH nuclease domain
MPMALGVSGRQLADAKLIDQTNKEAHGRAQRLQEIDRRPAHRDAGRKFVVPEYQRPYRWEREECETLWRDITDFFQEFGGDPSADDAYFLGTIVTSQDEQGARSTTVEVIDGQQRLTSLLLLLRAFYKKLEGMNADDKDVAGLKSQIAPCIWDVDRISGEVTDKGIIRLESKVATESDNEALHAILKTGAVDGRAKNLYAANYGYFYSECERFATEQPMLWKPLCVTILQNCIILPIECANLEVALRIFTTLNDRGMPLSDSDIFKAKMYGAKKGPARAALTEAWSVLAETVDDAKLQMDDLFRYYSHVIRARDGETGKEIGLRRF